MLLPATPRFGMSSLDPGPVHRIDARAEPPQQEVRHGRQGGPPDMRQFGGWFTFGAPDADLLVTLLPRMIHIRAAPRLAQLVQMLGCEVMRDDIGRTLILERLVEILLIGPCAPPRADGTAGVVAGAGGYKDRRRPPPPARRYHRPWTVPDLAGAAGMSRSAFSSGSPGWSGRGRWNI